MEIQIGVAKIKKYATSESGDSLEVVERPGGGVSIVLADGQRSGKSAKRISNMVVRKVISLLAEGVRDGAAARAASDYLYAHRSGKVLSTLNILSVDLQSKTMVITRNNPAPVMVGRNSEVELLDKDSVAVGIYRDTRPVITEIDLQEGQTVVLFTDGLVHAGDRIKEGMDIKQELTGLLGQELNTQEVADGLLDRAMTLDEGRPIDDISVVVLQVLPSNGDEVRRMSVRFPIG
ncbi:MAG: serine/threonine-protein phosphatase [Anaerolineae bacterium]|nr:serine/threonine-protein phosphatase [Anaerolineae bacterium]